MPYRETTRQPTAQGGRSKKPLAATKIVKRKVAAGSNQSQEVVERSGVVNKVLEKTVTTSHDCD